MSKISFGFFDEATTLVKLPLKTPTTMQPNSTKRDILMDLVKEILYNSAAQAILKIFKTKSKIIKIFWVTCLLLACAMCTYFVIESLILFFTYEVSTQTRTYTETSSLFPKITICNKNLFTTKYSYDLANGSSFTDFSNTISFKMNDSERLKLIHPFEAILFSCTFNAEKCTAQDDFIREYDKSLGNCYTFNAGSNRTLHESMRAGVYYGLNIDLYVNFYEKLAKDYNRYMGAIVKVGNSSYATTSYGIEVAPGFNTNIVVERYFEKTLPKPYSNCDIDNENVVAGLYSDLYDLVTHSPLEYNQQLCIDLCLQRKLIEKCNCTTSDKYGFFPTVGPCKTKDPCSDGVSLDSQSNEYIKANCLYLCPLQCNRTQYKTSISSSILMGDQYVEKIRNCTELFSDFSFDAKKVDSNSARNSVLSIHIYYETLSYTESNEKATAGSILALASTIGGILSLFLSLSVMSLFEVIEFLYEFLFIVKK